MINFQMWMKRSYLKEWTSVGHTELITQQIKVADFIEYKN